MSLDPLEIAEISAWPVRRGITAGPPVPTLRVFSDQALQASIDKILDDLPADHRAAELEVAGDDKGIAVIGAVRLDHGWSLLGGVSWEKGSSVGWRMGARWSGK